MTTVGGTVDADVTWAAADSPYLVVSSVVVPVGVRGSGEAG